MIVQLRKFSEAAKRIKAALSTPSQPTTAAGDIYGSVGGTAAAKNIFNEDLSSVLSTDITDMDSTVVGKQPLGPGDQYKLFLGTCCKACDNPCGH